MFQIRTMMLGGVHGAAATGWPAELMWWLTRSVVGGAIQAICPLLLLGGLLSRLAALAMLLQALSLPYAAGAAAIAPWPILLGWLVVSGQGAFSVDRLLLPSTRSSAMPGLSAAASAVRWIGRVFTPAFLLGVRLLPAITLAALLGGTLAVARVKEPMLQLSASGMSALIRLTPQPVSLTIAFLLAAGLFVRPVALIMATSGLVGMATMAGHDAVAWLLLCGLLLVHGAGALSLDKTLATWARTPASDTSFAASPYVIVVGGGFGGIAAARGLETAACRVTLIDRCNHSLFQPLLYQVATAGLSPADIATPIREIFRDQANVRVMLGEVNSIDVAAKTVGVGRTSLSYDYLVLATGAQHSYLGRDDWGAYAPGLKSLDDAVAIRRRLLLAFEEAEIAEDPADRAAWLTFLIVGCGPTGVELSGAIAELARYGLSGEFRRIDPAQARVILVHAGPYLLPTFPQGLSADAERSLQDLGVAIRLNARVTDVRPDGVTIGGAVIPARTVLWAAGVMASPAAQWLGSAVDRAGRLVVNADLSVPGAPGVFAIGDTIASEGWDGKTVPGLAPAAQQGGKYVARVIRSSLVGRPASRVFRYRHRGSLATIGRQAAVADFGRVRFRGALAWWFWGAVHITFLVGGRNRVIVMVEWLWVYLTYRRGSQLITGQSTGL